MDYEMLLATFRRQIGPQAYARMPRQNRLYASLRAAILSGKIEEGTRLLSSRWGTAAIGWRCRIRVLKPNKSPSPWGLTRLRLRCVSP